MDHSKPGFWRSRLQSFADSAFLDVRPEQVLKCSYRALMTAKSNCLHQVIVTILDRLVFSAAVGSGGRPLPT